MCSFFQQRQARARAEREERLQALRVVRPSLPALTISAEGEVMRTWSLIPSWAKQAKLKFSTFNARAETISEKPAFREAWRRGQRCLIPADSYGEYPVVEGRKQRHDIAREDGQELMIAGLWSDWRGADETRNTFTMITTAALDQIAWVHARSPLMLGEADLDVWLHASPETCLSLLQPRAPGALRVSPSTSI